MRKVFVGAMLLVFFAFGGFSVYATAAAAEKEWWPAPTPKEAQILDGVLARIATNMNKVDVNFKTYTQSVIFSKGLSKGLSKYSSGIDRLTIVYVPGAFEAYWVQLGVSRLSLLMAEIWFDSFLQVSVVSTDCVHGALFKKIKTLYLDGRKATEDRKKIENEENLKKAAGTFRWTSDGIRANKKTAGGL